MSMRSNQRFIVLIGILLLFVTVVFLLTPDLSSNKEYVREYVLSNAEKLRQHIAELSAPEEAFLSNNTDARRYPAVSSHNVSFPPLPQSLVDGDFTKTSSTRTPLKRRKNMEKCAHIHGKVTIFVAYVENSLKEHYGVALSSLRCYLASTPYDLLFVDIKKDERVKKECGRHQELFFLKHCAARVYLPETDWLVVLDADTAVVNPNHCIEEWIDDQVNVIFYERVFNWEIAAGNYIIRNTGYSLDLLAYWASWEWHQPRSFSGSDNGVLQAILLETAVPSAIHELDHCLSIWERARTYEEYMNYVTCCKINMGAQRLYPGKIRVYRRAHGWVRDGFLTADEWSESDFMLHGMKPNDVGVNGWDSPFTKVLDPSKCEVGYAGWEWRPNKRVDDTKVQWHLANYEKREDNYPKEAQELPYLHHDIAACYPHCDDV